jgi:16S rRNA processing protein RimM
MPQPKNPIQMAVIGAAHGIKGELRVKTFTGDPLALGDYGPLYAKDGRAFEVADIRPAKDVVVVRFKAVSDRNAAEALTGTELFVDRSALPDDGDEDDFYHADLVGLSVRDDTGAGIGKVVAVQNFGGGDILDLTLGARKGVLIPFSKAAVPEVSVAGGYIRVDPVAAGLVDDEDGDGEPDFVANRGETAPGRPGFDGKRRPRGPKDAGGNR